MVLSNIASFSAESIRSTMASPVELGAGLKGADKDVCDASTLLYE